MNNMLEKLTDGSQVNVLRRTVDGKQNSDMKVKLMKAMNEDGYEENIF